MEEEQLSLFTGLKLPQIIQHANPALGLSEKDIVKFVGLSGDPFTLVIGLAFHSEARWKFPPKMQWHWMEVFFEDANSHREFVLSQSEVLWDGQAKKSFQWLNKTVNDGRSTHLKQPAQLSMDWNTVAEGKANYTVFCEHEAKTNIGQDSAKLAKSLKRADSFS